MAEQLWHVGGPYMLRLELRLGLRLGLEMCGCCGVVVLEAERLWHAREPRALGLEPDLEPVGCVAGAVLQGECHILVYQAMHKVFGVVLVLPNCAVTWSRESMASASVSAGLTLLGCLRLLTDRR